MRLQTTLSTEMVNILNEQIALEANASAKYLAMASWASINGFHHSYEFLVAQSDEERQHMMKLFNYVAETGGMPQSPAVELQKHDYTSLKEVFHTALENEVKVTNSINKIMDLCHQQKDYITATYMQWFVTEQMEEEQTARRVMELFELMGDQGFELVMIDERIGKLKG